MVGGSPVSMRVASLATEVMCLGLWNRQQLKIRYSLRGLKYHRVYDLEAVLHGQMSGISVRCILEMSDGDTESNFGGIAGGEGVGCLEGE